jgi:very-short-patch-repair endonuclease
MQKRQKTITELARELRNNPTESEKVLWEILRKRRLDGYRFLRQKPFIYQQTNQKRYFFIADFYCPEKKLVIELDGHIHDHQKYYDYQRDLVLQKLGLKTLRISNGELADVDAVKKKILNWLK